jgi:hypothetical protein
MADPKKDDLRTAAIKGDIRFDTFEHNGQVFGVRQMTPRIQQKLLKHKDDPSGRTAQLAIEIVCAVALMLDPEGKPLVDEIKTPVMQAVIGDDGKPVTEPMLGTRGEPIISVEGKALMQAVMKQKVDADGQPVFDVTTKAKYMLGDKLFDDTYFETFMDQGSDEDSFLYKVAMTAQRVNDRGDAKARAKKS